MYHSPTITHRLLVSLPQTVEEATPLLSPSQVSPFGHGFLTPPSDAHYCDFSVNLTSVAQGHRTPQCQPPLGANGDSSSHPEPPFPGPFSKLLPPSASPTTHRRGIPDPSGPALPLFSCLLRIRSRILYTSCSM